MGAPGVLDAGDDTARGRVARAAQDAVHEQHSRASSEARKANAAVSEAQWAINDYEAAAAKKARVPRELAAIVDGVCRGQDSLTPKDVGECLQETTRRLEFLKVVTDNADAGFAQRDEFDDLGGPVVGLDE